MEAQIKLEQTFGTKPGLYSNWLLIALVMAVLLAGYFGAADANWDWSLIWGLAIITALLFFMALVAHKLSAHRHSSDFRTPDGTVNLQPFPHDYLPHTGQHYFLVAGQNEVAGVTTLNEVKGKNKQFPGASKNKRAATNTPDREQITSSARSSLVLRDQLRKERQAMLAAQLAANAKIRQHWMESNPIEVRQLQRDWHA